METLSAIHEQINRLQPDILPPEDRAALPHDAYIPILSDIVLQSLCMALFMVFLRYIFDRFVAYPFGAYFGLKDQTKKIQIYHQPLLEAEYKKTKSPSHDAILSLSKKTGMKERSIQIWFRKRKQLDQASDIKRLSDAGWSFIFYSILSFYGLYALWDKPWFTDTMQCWIGWPGQHVTNDIYWYYLIELGFYMSYLYMLFTDHKRKDFVEFLVHHSVTVVLMLLSWSINVVRIGTLVLVIHDQVDYWLAIAKIFIYIKKNVLADVCFAIFLLFWIVTRLFVYPYVVLYAVYIALPAYAVDKPFIRSHDRSIVGQLLKALLVVLQILHILWTIIIFKSAYRKIVGGKLQDSRSDTEEDEEGYESDIENIEDNSRVTNGITNGSVIADKTQVNGKTHVGKNGIGKPCR